MAIPLNNLILLLFLFNFIKSSWSRTVDDTCCNLRIYEDRNLTGHTVDYFNSPLSFKYAAAWVAVSGLVSVEWICYIKGIFILYKNPLYQADSLGDSKVYTGKGICNPPPAFGVGSIRHSSVVFWDPDVTPYITLFSGLFYGGNVQISVRTVEAVKIKGQTIRSFLTVGPTKWKVKTESGKDFCISPSYESKEVHVCLVPNIAELMGHDPLDHVWKIVGGTQTCESEEIPLKICFNYATGEAQEPGIPGGPSGPYPPDRDELGIPIPPGGPNPNGPDSIGGPGGSNPNEPSGPNPYDPGNPNGPGPNGPNPLDPDTPREPGSPGEKDAEMCESCFDTDDNCDDHLEAAFLIRLRVTHDFSDSYQFILPLNKMHSWRTELLDASFDVITETGLLPGDSPIINLLEQVREYFVYIIEKLVWSQGEGFPENKPTQDLNIVLHETKECIGKMKSWATVRAIQAKAMKVASQLENLKKVPPGLVSKPFKIALLNDRVMDFVWMIFNMVSMLCHEAKGYESNFWLDYHIMVKEMYLKPLGPHWRKNKSVRKLYPVILSGVGLNFHYKLLAIYASTIYERIPFVDIIKRPLEINKKGAPKKEEKGAAAATDGVPPPPPPAEGA